jgi:hypothetical protein
VEVISEYWGWIVVVAIPTATAFLVLYKKWLDIRKAKAEVGAADHQREIKRIADKLLATVRPSREAGNLFDEEYLADFVKEDKELTRKALFELQQRNLVHQQTPGWWRFEPRAPNPKIW